MSNIKENVVVTILKYWPVKYLITLLLLILVYTGFNHIYRRHNDLNSKFLWGASECQECIIQPVRIDTLIRDTCIRNDKLQDGKNVFNTKINQAKTVQIGPKK